jgi:hypothetical protein
LQLAGKHLTFDVELLTLTAQDSLQKATFGAGCFWGPELAFQRVAGGCTRLLDSLLLKAWPEVL